MGAGCLLEQAIILYGQDLKNEGMVGEMLARLLKNHETAAPAGDAVAVLAGAVARTRNQGSLASVIDAAADGTRPMWQRIAVLRGASMGLEAGGGRGGGRVGAPARGRGGAAVTLTREPAALISLAGGSGSILGSVLGALIMQSLDSGPVSPFTVVNGTLLSRNFGNRFDLSASVYNLLDKKYFDPPSAENLQLPIQQDGRSFRVKLTWQLGSR